MKQDRMVGFSDGVFAVIITIMVLELKVPQGVTFDALKSIQDNFLTYVISFVYVAIYWNNHHHMLTVSEKTNGAILWANLHLLFWLSLVPFTCGWLGASNLAPAPVATYSFVLLMCGLSYSLLQTSIIRMQGKNSKLKEAIGKDVKGKVSLVIYLVAIGCSFNWPLVGVGFAALPALIWFIPDRRIESRV